MTKAHIKAAYRAGIDWRDQHGEVKAQDKAVQLKKRIRRGTEKRYATQACRAIISGLLGEIM